jgi:hypothetical protein
MVEPRIAYLPQCKISAAVKREQDRIWKETEEVLAIAGLELDPWQELVLRVSLRLRAKDLWLAMEVGVNVGRQNGKGALIEARQLAGIYVLREPLQIYSSHHFKTSLEAFSRLEQRILDTELERQIKRNKYGDLSIKHTHGEEGIEFANPRRRVTFQTRTKGSGRGLTCNTLYGDEAMFFAEFQHGALKPTLSAVHNPQVWYAGSAVDQEIHEHGLVFARVRERAIKGDDPDLIYFEWSAGNGEPEKDHPSAVFEETAVDPAAWAQANPALGIRIRPEVIAAEQRSMAPRSFAVERLGVGDWPDPNAIVSTMIRLEDWNALVDSSSSMEAVDALAFDVSPDRRASIAAVGANLQELWHLEVIDNREGTSWLPARVAELVERHRPRVVVCGAHSPASGFIAKIEELGVKVRELSTDEHSQACGRFVDAVGERGLRHPGGSVLAGAIRGAKARPFGDAWLWSRRNSDVDISPLVAGTLALSAAIEGKERSVYDERGLIAV